MHDPDRSDPRDCASKEPKPEQMDSGPGYSEDRRKPETFFQRLSHRASEKKSFGTLFSETGPDPPGNDARA
jgi:hypothetical protein